MKIPNKSGLQQIALNHSKVEYIDFQLAITKSYFKNDNLEVYTEKKVNKELCTQFGTKSKSNLQIYIVNFFSSGRVVINARCFRKELPEMRIPMLEELYGTTFDIKGVKQLIQTTSKSEPDHSNNQDNIHEHTKTLTTFERETCSEQESPAK